MKITQPRTLTNKPRSCKFNFNKGGKMTTKRRRKNQKESKFAIIYYKKILPLRELIKFGFQETSACLQYNTELKLEGIKIYYDIMYQTVYFRPITSQELENLGFKHAGYCEEDFSIFVKNDISICFDIKKQIIFSIKKGA